MDPTIVAALIGAGSSLLGGIFGSSGQAQTNAQQMAFNSREAQIARDWQEKMRATAYQTTMGDMRLAGLNPILAGQLGASGTPPGIAANVSLQNPGQFLQQGVTSAGALGEKYFQMQSVQAQAGKDLTQAGLNKASTAVQDATVGKVVQDTATSAAQMQQAIEQSKQLSAGTRNMDIQSEILKHDITSAEGRARITQMQADHDKRYGYGPGANVMGNVERGGRTGRTLIEDIVKDVMNQLPKAGQQPNSPSPSPNPPSATPPPGTPRGFPGNLLRPTW